MLPIEKLKNKIFNKNKYTITTNLIAVAREFSCLSDVIGRDFEVYDKDGKIIYTIRQKPMNLNQVNKLTKELINIKNMEQAKKGRSNK